MFGGQKPPIDIHGESWFLHKNMQSRLFLFSFRNTTIREAALVFPAPRCRVQLSSDIYGFLYSTSKEPLALGYACKSPKWHLCRDVWHSSEARARQSLFSFVKEFILRVLKPSQKVWSASAAQPRDVLTNHTKSIPVCGRLGSSNLSKH